MGQGSSLREINPPPQTLPPPNSPSSSPPKSPAPGAPGTIGTCQWWLDVAAEIAARAASSPWISSAWAANPYPNLGKHQESGLSQESWPSSSWTPGTSLLFSLVFLSSCILLLCWGLIRSHPVGHSPELGTCCHRLAHAQEDATAAAASKLRSHPECVATSEPGLPSIAKLRDLKGPGSRTKTTEHMSFFGKLLMLARAQAKHKIHRRNAYSLLSLHFRQLRTHGRNRGCPQDPGKTTPGSKKNETMLHVPSLWLRLAMLTWQRGPHLGKAPSKARDLCHAEALGERNCPVSSMPLVCSPNPPKVTGQAGSPAQAGFFTVTDILGVMLRMLRKTARPSVSSFDSKGRDPKRPTASCTALKPRAAPARCPLSIRKRGARMFE